MNEPLKELKQKIASLRTVMSSLRRFREEPGSELLEYIIMQYEQMLNDSDNTRERIIESTHITSDLLYRLTVYHNDIQTRYLHHEFEVLAENVSTMVPAQQPANVA